MIKDSFSKLISGSVELRVYRGGKLVNFEFSKNKIVDRSFGLLRDLFHTSTGTDNNRVRYMVFGNRNKSALVDYTNDNETVGDTATDLLNKTFAKNVGTPVAVAEVNGVFGITYSCSLGVNDNNGIISEIGLFTGAQETETNGVVNSGSLSNLRDRAFSILYRSPIQKDNTMTLDFSWTISFGS